MSSCDGTQISDPTSAHPRSMVLARPFRNLVRDAGDLPFVQLSLLMRTAESVVLTD